MKLKTSPTGAVHKEPVHHKTTQGNGRGSRPKCGKKLRRGQGK